MTPGTAARDLLDPRAELVRPTAMIANCGLGIERPATVADRPGLGDLDAPGRALQRALDPAEPDQVLFRFLSHPSPGLLGRHARHHTADAALISETANLLTRMDRPAPLPSQPTYYRGALTDGEARVLHYPPASLSAREIAGELYQSVNTVKTHQRHLHQSSAHAAVRRPTSRPVPRPARTILSQSLTANRRCGHGEGST